MLIYCDSVVLIYLLDNVAHLRQRATRRLVALQQAGDKICVSDLVRLECQVRPLRLNNTAALARFDRFFALPRLQFASFSRAVFERAARIRAAHRFQTVDSLHLAAAMEAGCNAILTNDHRLRSFTDLAVEVLP